MTNNTGPTWNRIITVASAFGIPIVGLAFAGVVLITRMDDKMTNFQIKQQEQGDDIKGIKEDVNALRIRIDTLNQRQRDGQKANEYRFLLQEHEHKK